MTNGRAYVVVLGDREPIAWVLSEARMAFSANRAHSASSIPVGTDLILYATRGAFRNPSRDRGRIFGRATTIGPVAPLDPAVRFGDRTFSVGCDLRIDALAPLHAGPELQPLASQLHAFPIAQAWSVYLRRPLVPLDEHDFRLLTEALRKVAGNPAETLPAYVSEADKGRG